jgi:hypothetical protein
MDAEFHTKTGVSRHLEDEGIDGWMTLKIYLTGTVRELD